MSTDPHADLDEPEAKPPKPVPERILAQPEIDALTGFRAPAPPASGAGLRAVLSAAAPSGEPLPMLAWLLDRAAERLSTSLRGIFGCDVEVLLRSLAHARFGECIDETILPCQLVLFESPDWGGPGQVTIGPEMARIVLDALLGAGRDQSVGRTPVRPFTPLEGAILSRFVGVVLTETAAAFAPHCPVTFRIERLESDPRLSDVARPADGVYAAEFGFDVEGRAGRLTLILPTATLEPVRDQLRGSFMGEKTGHDPAWARHFATELWQADIRAEAVLHEVRLPLRRVLELGIGDTLMFDTRPSDPVTLRGGGRTLARGRMGRVDGRIALRLIEPLRGPAPGQKDAAP